MRLIITDKLPLTAGRFTIQETTFDLARAIVQDCPGGVEIISAVGSEETAKRISELLGCNVVVASVEPKHGDELIIYDGNSWWHCWYYND